MGGNPLIHETRNSPPEPACEPLWTFRCPNFGYDIALVPHSERDRIRLKRQAKRKGMSLADFARASGSIDSVPGDRIFVPAQANAGPVGRDCGAVDNL